MINSSCIYKGTVVHKRFKPKKHFFKYNVFSMLIDLDEINELDKRFWDPVKQLDADRKDQLLGTAAAEVDVPGVRVPAAPLAVDKD